MGALGPCGCPSLVEPTKENCNFCAFRLKSALILLNLLRDLLTDLNSYFLLQSLIVNEELESELERRKEEIADLKEKVIAMISVDIRTSNN